MFIEVLECVLRKTHSLLIRMLLLKELLSWRVMPISQYDLSSLALNVYHLTVTWYPSAILGLARAKLRLRTHRIRRHVLIEALWLLLPVHPWIVSLLHTFVVHGLLLAQLTLGVHGDVPMVLQTGRLLCRWAACFGVSWRVVDDWEEAVTLVVEGRASETTRKVVARLRAKNARLPDECSPHIAIR